MNKWTGNAHVAIEMELYNFEGITLYEKWLADNKDYDVCLFGSYRNRSEQKT